MRFVTEALAQRRLKLFAASWGAVLWEPRGQGTVNIIATSQRYLYMLDMTFLLTTTQDGMVISAMDQNCPFLVAVEFLGYAV